jgi:hypothetical protein
MSETCNFSREKAEMNYTPPLPFVTWNIKAAAHTYDPEVRVNEMVDSYLACARMVETQDDEDWAGLEWADGSRNLAWFECCAFLRLARWDINGWSMAQLGENLWLTRNGHGSGFWDKDFGIEVSRNKLTALAHTLSESYVSAYDNKLYLEL